MEPSFTTDKLEQELKQAQQFGRWLSDEERLALEEEKTQALRMIEQQRHRRLRLIVLTAVCLVIPPLWGIAAGLSFYLLFPETAKRLALIASGGLIVLAMLSALMIGFLLITIADLLF
ncbi:hypothetical protein [Synechococcus sp. UW179B]|uniref:hypothetical protein n=1 Tax=Synechococcus sp. UW179B TaxID=2575516 RepID=UPI000E0E595A|nr:hypothetical protein [Synechococcus sp. UW179B]